MLTVTALLALTDTLYRICKDTNNFPHDQVYYYFGICIYSALHLQNFCWWYLW